MKESIEDSSNVCLNKAGECAAHHTSYLVPALSSPNEFRRSWRVLCVGMLGLPVSLMPAAAIGVFISPLSNAFGWSLTAISGVAFCMGLGTIIASPIEGRLIDRYGVRRIILFGIPLLAASVAAASLIGQEIWTLYLVMFIWSCASSGAVSTYVRAIRGSFITNGGKAIGLMFTAGGIGCTIAPSMAQWAVDRFGWQIGYASLSAAVLLAWPVAYHHASVKTTSGSRDRGQPRLRGLVCHR